MFLHTQSSENTPVQVSSSEHAYKLHKMTYQELKEKEQIKKQNLNPYRLRKNYSHLSELAISNLLSNIQSF